MTALEVYTAEAKYWQIIMQQWHLLLTYLAQSAVS